VPLCVCMCGQDILVRLHEHSVLSGRSGGVGSCAMNRSGGYSPTFFPADQPLSPFLLSLCAITRQAANGNGSGNFRFCSPNL